MVGCSIGRVGTYSGTKHSYQCKMSVLASQIFWLNICAVEESRVRSATFSYVTDETLFLIIQVFCSGCTFVVKLQVHYTIVYL